MTRPRRLRTRLLVAMTSIALGVLVLTALATAGLARRTAASSARSDLEKHAPVVAQEFDKLFRRANTAIERARRRNTTVVPGAALGAPVKALIQTTLEVSDGSIIAIDDSGNEQELLGRVFGAESELLHLPRGVQLSDLDTSKLLAGAQQTGQDGDTVFTAVPLTQVQGLTPVLVLAKHVENRPFGQSEGTVLGAAVLALAIAVVVGAYLARRLTRPLAAMQATAGKIATGDLSARVDRRLVPDDELGRLADAINTMAEELQAAEQHERSFLLSVSHDLRTPLTSIRGYAEAIADGTVAGDDAQARAADVIGAEARRLERLVADLLDLARLDAHQFSLKVRPIDARQVVEETVAGFLPAAGELGVRLALAADGSAPASADPERLAQVVANLVENALKFAAAQVTVGVRVTESTVEVWVDDDGPGIAAADLPHVFERLYTSRTAPGRTVGTGIGLAIVRELTVAMGGSARVEPITGVGTRFVVQLPERAERAPGSAGSR